MILEACLYIFKPVLKDIQWQIPLDLPGEEITTLALSLVATAKNGTARDLKGCTETRKYYNYLLKYYNIEIWILSMCVRETERLSPFSRLQVNQKGDLCISTLPDVPLLMSKLGGGEQLPGVHQLNISASFFSSPHTMCKMSPFRCESLHVMGTIGQQSASII